MMDDEIYTFHIDAFTPETMPMARLAEYMAVLATMLGERTSVHFQRLETGSTRLVSRIEREAAPKVRDNINSAQSGDATTEVAKAYKLANDMLRKDNAEGMLERCGSNVLAFPGRKAPRPVKLGPFNQTVEKDGVLVRIGGTDKTAHATIEDSDRETWSFEVTRELAIELAHHLFGKPIRLVGTGRFFRDEDARWQHTTLKATGFELLNAASLAEVVGKIRRLPEGTWKDNPTDLLRRLRDDGDAH